MKLLAVMRPAGERDVRDAVRARARAELDVLWRLYCDGVVREMYSPGGPGSVLILEATSVDAAQQRLGELPLLRDQVMVLELTELRPFAALQILFSRTDRPAGEGEHDLA